MAKIKAKGIDFASSSLRDNNGQLDIASAVAANFHVPNSDTKLANGTGNEVTAAAIRSFIDSKAANSGLASLGSDGKIPNSQLPALALSEFKGVVANEGAMTAVTAEIGDFVRRSDTGKLYFLSASPASTAANWVAASDVTGVHTVNGEAGDVTLDAGDIGYTGDLGDDVQSAIDALLDSLTSSQADITTLQSEMSAAQSAITTNSDDIDALQSDVSTLESSLSSGNSSLQGQIDSLDGRLDTAEGTITSQGSTLSSHTSTLSSQASTISSQGSTISSHTSTLSSHTSSLASHASAISALQSADTALDARLDTAESDIDTLQSGVTTLQSRTNLVWQPVTLTSGMIAAKQVELNGTPADAAAIKVVIRGIGQQFPELDFSLVDGKIDWNNSEGMAALSLVAGDRLWIEFAV